MRTGIGAKHIALHSRMQVSTECSCDGPALSHPTCSVPVDSIQADKVCVFAERLTALSFGQRLSLPPKDYTASAVRCTGQYL